MRRILLIILLLPLALKAQTIKERLTSSGMLYDKGVEAFSKKEYRTADSLFEASLSLYPHNDTYFNLAVTKKYLGDMAGFSQNMKKAMIMGDSTAGKIFYKECMVIADGKSAYLLNYDYALIFRKAKTIKYQEFEKLDKMNTVRLKYSIEGNDTTYFVTEELDSIDHVMRAALVHLRKNLVYPIPEREAGISGICYLSFTILKDGSVNDIGIFQSDRLNFSVAAAYAMSSAKKLPYLYYKGKPVNARILFPVRFTIR